MLAHFREIADAVGAFLLQTDGTSPRVVAQRVRHVVGPAAQVTDLVDSRRVVGSNLTAVELSRLTRVELGFALVLAIAATGVALGLGFQERRRTFAIAAALGARTRQLGGFVWSESAFVTGGGLVLGTAIFAAYGLVSKRSSDEPGKIVGVLDWEMSTIGDPLADLGYLCALWSDADDPERGILEPSPVTRQPGFLRREELIARYEQIAGRRTTDIRWYQALAVWKAIVFMEGNYKRALAGTTDDPFLAAFGEGVMQLVSWAETLVSSQAETKT